MTSELQAGKTTIKQLEYELGIAKMMISQHYESRRKAEKQRDDLKKELQTLTMQVKSLVDERQYALNEKEKVMQDKQQVQIDNRNALRQIKILQNSQIQKTEQF